jgi:hypothetical protein
LTLSIASIIGACLGFILGLVDYKAVGGIVEGKLREKARNAPMAEREKVETRIRIFKRLLFVMTVLAFPVVGYLFGAQLGTG